MSVSVHLVFATVALLISTELGMLVNAECVDSDSRCAGWAASTVQAPVIPGDALLSEGCNANRDWMLKNCPNSCHVCVCGDNNAGCPGWAARGECDKSPNYMKFHCRLSCKMCEKEKDHKTIDVKLITEYLAKQAAAIQTTTEAAAE